MFKPAIEQNRVLVVLNKLLAQNRLPHSFLFYGPPGSGKKAMGLALAKYLNCENKSSGDNCHLCKMIEQHIHPDVVVIDNAENSIKIEEIREVTKILSLKPFISRYKFFILNNCENLTPEAANAFLKSLEEPALNNFIILITDNIFSILPTVRSRCFLVEFQPVSKAAIKKIFIQQGLSDNDAEVLSLIFNGNLDLIVQYKDLVINNFYFIKNYILTHNFSKIALFNFIKEVSENNYLFLLFFDLFFRLLMDLLIFSYFGSATSSKYLTLLKPEECRKIQPEKIFETLEFFKSKRAQLRFNINKVLLLENILIKLSEI